ncbi:MAG: hypothetical protein WD512_14700 [Candidatus Paceibacterota bacterium]
MIDPTDFDFESLDFQKVLPQNKINAPIYQSSSPNTNKSFIVPVVVILFVIGAIVVASNFYNEIQNEKNLN